MRRILIYIIFFSYFKLGFTHPQMEFQSNMQEINQYIEKTWSILTRDNTNLLADSDEKLPHTQSIIYLPPEENLNKIKNKVTQNWPEWKKKKVIFKYLPRDISTIKQHGLLYLPHPYIVPGGRFNEMYGWDSYFIELGLIEHNRLTMARNMIDNLIYEIDHYGTILNANRTYYLQRSQPPLLTAMILAYYEKTQDKKWLASTLPAIKKLHTYWTTPPHLIPDLGLSRYYAGGQGKPPEESTVYYEKVLNYFKTHDISDYDKSLFYTETSNQLTELFYIADRTVRESGFDITAKFGPFSAGILDYAPVDLNVLIYQMENDLGIIYKILGNKENATIWTQKAEARAALINHYLWDDKAGYYFDYNFKTKQLRPYIYATTFYPLWAGIASKDQAQSLVNNLPVLLTRGGLLTSCYIQGVQWDAPFGWAPLQYFAVLGLNRYGYKELALDIANRFVNTIHIGFQEAHTLFEKYDVQNMSIHTENKIQYSYNTNVVGFGWTNGVYLVFNRLINANN
ncbi:trehalase family glycosidase [Legionella pneumophila]|uniref:trehalase family glycosidase n=1 Tax=Legionella pneumophila TaxID=446 RepID=UPI000770888E|nr:trehalase family glycosidase [Legionella pneumophila]HAT9717452.1 alpha,alpha-trehalase [Legionella pneumophila subsp. pneumophila]CZG87929.1 Periplasmic trehalase precursor [Legionella pneumophila]HAT1981332.1 alpha,alpha-trehalase [Legionella pneumophila]HAT4423545.1 alpha,alpha-trehalase [Legionella pneumophila]HAU1719722.1 alpha,alpha-trehalase [Legionella pneumophila]